MIRPSDICFHMPIMRIHRHKTCTEEVFVIADRIHRCHDCILFTIPGKYRHFFRCIESFFNLGIRCPGFLHDTITVGLFHSAGKNFIYLLLRNSVTVRRFFTSFLFFEEIALQFFQVLFYRLFCILLHTGVNSGINFQTVCIKIIFRAIFLSILFTPTK